MFWRMPPNNPATGGVVGAVMFLVGFAAGAVVGKLLFMAIGKKE